MTQHECLGPGLPAWDDFKHVVTAHVRALTLEASNKYGLAWTMGRWSAKDKVRNVTAASTLGSAGSKAKEGMESGFTPSRRERGQFSSCREAVGPVDGRGYKVGFCSRDWHVQRIVRSTSRMDLKSC